MLLQKWLFAHLGRYSHLVLYEFNIHDFLNIYIVAQAKAIHLQTVQMQVHLSSPTY